MGCRGAAEGSRSLAKPAPGSPGVTWYDVLGLLPGATADQVQRAYEAKARLLRPEFLSGAPSPVVAAASRAQEILGAARYELTDPGRRDRYDRAAGLRGSGGGLTRDSGHPSEPGTETLGAELLFGDAGAEVAGAVEALAGWLAPKGRQPGRVAVPDVRGLFYSVGLAVAGRAGLRVTAVRLTPHPLPVEGLIVSQSPRAPASARRCAALTVHVWHPPA
jgi:curved DNA-binding protein CbpA